MKKNKTAVAKPTKEWEEQMKTVIEPESSMFDFDEEMGVLGRLWWKISCVPYRLKDRYYDAKYYVQRKIRRHGSSDMDLFNLDTHLADVIVTKLKAFKKLKRHGVPGAIGPCDDFVGDDKTEGYWDSCSKNWENILDKIIAEMENVRDDKYFIEKVEHTLENKIVNYIFHNDADGTTIMTHYIDYDIGKPNVRYVRRSVSYFNASKEYKIRTPELFCKYFTSLWD